MKVLQINSVCGIRSTGRICTDIAEVLQSHGDQCKIGYGRCESHERYKDISVSIGGKLNTIIHGLGSRLFDNTGFYSKIATRRFLKWVDSYQPDLIHLHNIHGYYLNIELLFSYLKEKQIPVVWTLHDCWAITGHCSHFAAQGCERWKTQCYECPLKNAYPVSLLADNSRKNHKRKATLFSGVKSMQIVTPSNWLGSCVGESYLKDYPVQTIYNGINLGRFCPTKSKIAAKYGLENKKIVLGVASAWSEHKGLSHFCQLAKCLPDDYQVVLVGLTASQISDMPPEILGVERTNSVEELAQWYTAAYVHVSMSQEESMGLTIVEANACGTPVIVFDKTALPEIVTPQTGVVLKDCTPEAVAQALTENDFSKERYMQNCVSHAEKFEKSKMYERYIALYRSMMR